MNKMNWDKLLCDKRFGVNGQGSSHRELRSDFQRDYDRLIFSSPFRRLQNKTQVFPLPGSIFVHNRLTHSLEVASVGRSMALEVAQSLRKKYAAEEWVEKFNVIDDIVAAACLAHDLGNPPFGHSGEKAISTFFSEGNGVGLKDSLSAEQWNDLIHFEGNANAFRMLIHQFNGRRPGGFAMTYSTLASIVKYPYESSLAAERTGKFGFFTSERDKWLKVAGELGLLRRDDPKGRLSYARHPLVYLVEAADDICYEIMDLEDAHRLHIVSADEVIDLLLGFFDDKRRQHLVEVMATVDDPKEKRAYLRSSVIGTLVHQSAQLFVEHDDDILAGNFEGSLLNNLSQATRDAYSRCENLSYGKIYDSHEVVDIELAGNQILTYLLEKFIHAVCNPTLNYSKLLLSQVPDQYDVNGPDIFGRIQAILDHLSAMTDVYALDLYRRLLGMSLPAV